MEWMLLPYKRYAEFSGRSRRKEYWMFTLLVFLVYIVAFALMGLTGMFSAIGSDGSPQLSGIHWVIIALLVIFAIASFIPSLAVQIRRLHDQDKSGWFWLINFIPYVGGIIFLVFMCLNGTKGPNRFGDDPKGEQNMAEIFS
jgi:uncharacterized membrane protein YhaH (DUF805 family)